MPKTSSSSGRARYARLRRTAAKPMTATPATASHTLSKRAPRLEAAPPVPERGSVVAPAAPPDGSTLGSIATAASGVAPMGSVRTVATGEVVAVGVAVAVPGVPVGWGVPVATGVDATGVLVAAAGVADAAGVGVGASTFTVPVISSWTVQW